MIHLCARGVRALWEPEGGQLPELVIGGAEVLHRAPWRGDHDVQSDPSIPHVDRRLGGTFGCAPFGLDDVDHGPPHGRAANALWHLHRASGSALVASCRLSRGDVVARLVLRDGHPVLYQTHLLDLTEPCSFAHHPMLDLPGGGVISTNGHRVFTFEASAREGTALYLPGQDSSGPFLDTADGPRDWRDYPDTPCDDFLALTHEGGLAWTAVARTAQADTILMLARGTDLPLTGLWLSNGARTGRPWAGRGGVLGVEAGRFAGADGFAAALSGRTSVPGPTVLPVGRHLLPHAIVRVEGCHVVTALQMGAGHLIVQTSNGTVHVPFETEHFA